MQSNGRVPIGYVKLESAALFSGYSQGHIEQLARANIIGNKKLMVPNIFLFLI